jgi:hypothetical protein
VLEEVVWRCQGRCWRRREGGASQWGEEGECEWIHP